ncbi:MAG: hypothetical protein LBG52_01665 [Candidatus Peribacteria bacterium]|nr:hypothetical protein [Candidatus Peribacteria bacterium]
MQEIKNIPLEERLSPDIILSPDDERLDVMLELYSKYKYQEGQSLYNRIKTFVDIKQ